MHVRPVPTRCSGLLPLAKGVSALAGRRGLSTYVRHLRIDQEPDDEAEEDRVEVRWNLFWRQPHLLPRVLADAGRP